MKTQEEIEALVKENMKLINFILNRKFYTTTNKYDVYEDMYQEGSIALFRAAQQYDKNQGVKFVTFAYKVIYLKLLKFTKRKLRKYHMDAERLDEVVLSKNGESLTKIGLLGSEDALFKDVESEYKIKFKKAINNSERRDHQVKGIVQMRLQGKTQQEIGENLKTNQVHISRVLKRLKHNYSSLA